MPNLMIGFGIDEVQAEFVAEILSLIHIWPYDLVPIAMSILDVRDLIDVAVARTPEMIFRQPMVLLMFSSCYAVVLICSILQTRR